MTTLKEKILDKCFTLANLRTLRERDILHNRNDEAKIHDGYIDVEIDQLKKLVEEMDGEL